MDDVQIISQPFYLWRQWHLDPNDNSDLKLRSVGWNTSFVWEQPLVKAFCPTEDLQHVAPVEQCKCGIYGYATLQDMMLATFAGYTIENAFGLIQCYGRVQIHESGARVQYAKPLAVFVPPSLSHKLAPWWIKNMVDFYGASLEIIEPLTLYKRLTKRSSSYPNILPPVHLSGFTSDINDIDEFKIYSDFHI